MNNAINFIELTWLLPFIRAAIILIVGYYLATFLSRKSEKLTADYVSPQHIMIIKKSVYFIVLLLFVIASLQQLNFQLSVLLGSAGVATVAIGFAAKTSISNMICGVFLILEKSFVVGDTICVKGHQGEIMSIDFLSIKIRTTDNTMIRVPNEDIISSDVVNLTHFKHRRLTLNVAVGYGADFSKVQDILLKIAEGSTLNLKKPAATVILDNFGDSAINLKFSVWVNKADYNEAKNTLQQAIKIALEINDIESPSQQMKVQLLKSIAK